MTTFRPRCFHLTPDRAVIVLLAVEGVLWLSERLHWLPFNLHKGWAVLIAIAAVGVAMLLMLLWFVVALLFRWRFQFSIRSLLMLTVAVAVPCSWLALEMKNANEQDQLVVAISNLGDDTIKGEVFYDYQVGSCGYPGPSASPSEPLWMWNLLGEDFFADVGGVSLAETGIHDADLVATSVSR